MSRNAKGVIPDVWPKLTSGSGDVDGEGVESRDISPSRRRGVATETEEGCWNARAGGRLVTWGTQDGGGPGGAGNAEPRGSRGVRRPQCKPRGLQLGRRNESGTGRSWDRGGDGLDLEALRGQTGFSLL